MNKLKVGLFSSIAAILVFSPLSYGDSEYCSINVYNNSPHHAHVVATHFGCGYNDPRNLDHTI